MGLTDRFKGAWNAFLGRDPTPQSGPYMYGGFSTGLRPDRRRILGGHDRSIITAVYNRLAIDVASVNIEHVYMDQNKRFVGEVDSGLNYCLTVSANRDQTGRAFIQDVAMTMFDEGVVAIVIESASSNPNFSNSYDIYSLRAGTITQWYPKHVKVRLFNQDTGRHEEVVFAKDCVAIIENPLYAVMNSPNSTLQRLIRKLNLLDNIDEHNGSEKLDLIVQLPNILSNDRKQHQAEYRRNQIENQLSNSRYGIAYIGSTEKIIQLNRAVESNMMPQIEYLTSMLYSQLGLTASVFDGTADEKVMLNYYNRTIEPILSAIADEMKRKFLTPNARTRGQSIAFFRDPFRLVPINDLAELADKFTRNEIMTSNEIRQIIGMKPSDDPKADELINSNNRKFEDSGSPAVSGEEIPPEEQEPVQDDYEQM